MSPGINLYIEIKLWCLYIDYVRKIAIIIIDHGGYNSAFTLVTLGYALLSDSRGE